MRALQTNDRKKRHIVPKARPNGRHKTNSGKKKSTCFGMPMKDIVGNSAWIRCR